jgi:hypothetical protein
MIIMKKTMMTLKAEHVRRFSVHFLFTGFRESCAVIAGPLAANGKVTFVTFMSLQVFTQLV